MTYSLRLKRAQTEARRLADRYHARCVVVENRYGKVFAQIGTIPLRGGERVISTVDFVSQMVEQEGDS